MKRRTRESRLGSPGMIVGEAHERAFVLVGETDRRPDRATADSAGASESLVGSNAGAQPPITGGMPTRALSRFPGSVQDMNPAASKWSA